MPKHNYRHTVTNVEVELDDSFVTLFPGSFERVEEKAAEPVPVPQTAVKAPATPKKNDSSKEGNK